MKIYSYFEHTGNMVRPWAERGFECVCYDILNKETQEKFDSGDSITYQCLDIMSLCKPKQPYIAFAFPPCTHISNAGARHFQSKGLGKLVEALTLVTKAIYLIEEADLWMLENPVGQLSFYWRKYDYKFNPYEYGGYLPYNVMPNDAYSKQTCLWTSQTFLMPTPKPVLNILGSKMHEKVRDSSDRAITPKGFALAVCLTNIGRFR